MTAVLPVGVQPYKRKATFTETTTPAALLGDHATKTGVWGLIHVEEGSLCYLITDERRPLSEKILTPMTGPGIVEPTIAHRVEARGPVRFYVEFLR
ncbi:DUF1971 domain-containing protein [Sphingopyxis sp. H115]|uniref:DUF1971 domain-containing protein n=1 Tax=Sphingopyxis sp. H115 TaxID=1759073 RepID=UPI0009E75543|nr:DUF1971 domain-containing protein [Sphingopyxis sp. H115]